VHTRALADTALFRWFDGVTGPREPTARHVLQTLGTEWGRAFSKNMWIDLALSTARELLGGGYMYDRNTGLNGHPSAPFIPPSLVVITDGRFRNELLAVRAAGGATVRIQSPGAGLTGEAAKHASETEQNSIPASWFDVVLTNDKNHGLKGLEAAVGWLAEHHFPARPLEASSLSPDLLPHAIWKVGL
jgi:hypothetical protein